jgi:DNA replication protein DnaC
MVAAMREIERSFPARKFGPNVTLDDERNLGCAFIDWPDFISSANESDSALRSLLAWRGAMFVDDIGQELAVVSGYKQGWSESVFDRFVNRRTGIAAVLWMTSNLTPNEMRNRYGERALSRLSGHCSFIRFDGQDRRLTA